MNRCDHARGFCAAPPGTFKTIEALENHFYPKDGGMGNESYEEPKFNTIDELYSYHYGR